MSLLTQAVRDGIGLGYTLESYVREDLAAGRLLAVFVSFLESAHSASPETVSAVRSA